MAEIVRLIGSSDCFELDFLEREATPEPAMNLGIRLHLAGLSLLNTISILDRLGIERCRTTVHNWGQKADLQPLDGANPDHVAVDETVIQLNDERFWLYVAIDSDTNRLLHAKLSPKINQVITAMFLAELRENISSMTYSFSSILHRGCKQHSIDTASITDAKDTVNGTASDVSFENQNIELINFQIVSTTPNQTPAKVGCEHLLSHGTSLSEHYRPGWVYTSVLDTIIINRIWRRPTPMVF